MLNLLEEEYMSFILKKIRINHRTLEIGKDKFIAIVLFDDDEFSQIDFDIIDVKTRSKLLSAFEKKKFTIKNSRTFISSKGREYRLAKPSHTLGCNPADKLIETLSHDAATFCTPTQAILAMAALDDPKVLDEEFVKDFLSQLPVNVAKVRQWIRHDNLRDKFPHSFKEMQEWNKPESRNDKKKKEVS